MRSTLGQSRRRISCSIDVHYGPHRHHYLTYLNNFMFLTYAGGADNFFLRLCPDCAHLEEMVSGLVVARDQLSVWYGVGT